jgi:hypothetical protein
VCISRGWRKLSINRRHIENIEKWDKLHLAHWKKVNERKNVHARATHLLSYHFRCWPLKAAPKKKWFACINISSAKSNFLWQQGEVGIRYSKFSRWSQLLSSSQSIKFDYFILTKSAWHQASIDESFDKLIIQCIELERLIIRTLANYFMMNGKEPQATLERDDFQSHGRCDRWREIKFNEQRRDERELTVCESYEKISALELITFNRATPKLDIDNQNHFLRKLIN